MRFPKFWADATVRGTAGDGRPVAFSCWRSSDVDEDDARQSALVVAQRALQTLLAGRRLSRYPYGVLPLREEVLDRMEDGAGNAIAVITRNASGVLVLNTQRVMFIDIDFPPMCVSESLGSLIGRLFSWSRPSPEDNREAQARSQADRFLAENPGWGLRLYRTCAGLRGIATHGLFDPTDAGTIESLRRLGCDPLYVRLCKAQDCFRARLTPKPWRCGYFDNSIRYPLVNEEAARRYAEWVSDYDQYQSQFATCRYLGQYGNREIHPEVAQIVKLHDMATRIGESLKLA